MPKPAACPSPISSDEEFYTLANSFAHEIRNPLNALQLNLKLLSDEVTSSQKASAKVAAALREVKRLDDLVSSFLRLARPRHPRPVTVDLGQILRELSDFVTPQFYKGEKELTVAYPSSLTLTTDPDLLKQALLNVILNALEFSVRCTTIEVKDEGTSVAILITDDGPGFQDPIRAMVPFYSTKPDGIGLGLPTAANLAKALGGTVEVLSSRPGGKVLIRLPKNIVGSPTD